MTLNPVRKNRWFVKTLALLVVLMVVGIVALPWQQWLATRLEHYLEGRGFADVALTIDHVGFDGITFSNVRLGGKQPLAFNNLTITYSFLDKSAGRSVNGHWRIAAMEVRNTPVELPPVHGEGTYSLQPQSLAIQGKFASADGAYHATFVTDYLFNVPSTLTVTEAAMPWHGGIVSAGDVRVALDKNQPISTTVTVQRVLVDEILRSVTGGRASATGVISGVLPITILPDGPVILHEGKLHAESPGTVAMNPEAIPGDNPQVALVRDVLQNFHYDLLSAEVSNDKNNKLSLLLRLEGRNPDAQAGKPVKLNVTLTGNVLDLFQQSITSFTDPRKFLESGQNAQP